MMLVFVSKEFKWSHVRIVSFDKLRHFEGILFYFCCEDASSHDSLQVISYSSALLQCLCCNSNVNNDIITFKVFIERKNL